MNMSGFIVLGLGIFVLVVALKGTQANVFPFFFGQNGSLGGGSSGNLPPCVTAADSSGKCPPGYNKILGQCSFNGPVDQCSGINAL